MNQVSPETLVLGKVVGPHGIRGMLQIISYADSERSLINEGSVVLRTISGQLHSRGVVSLKAHKRGFLLELEGLTSRTEAEQYRGAEILVDKAALQRDDDEYFWQELLDLDVYLETGSYLGRITRIISSGGHDIYAIRDGEDEFLIPATHEVVQEIDLRAGRMIISPTEGLLEVNEV